MLITGFCPCCAEFAQFAKPGSWVTPRSSVTASYSVRPFPFDGMVVGAEEVFFGEDCSGFKSQAPSPPLPFVSWQITTFFMAFQTSPILVAQAPVLIFAGLIAAHSLSKLALA